MKYMWVVLVMLVAIVPAFAVSDNWIKNGDFELGMAGWSTGIGTMGYTGAPSIAATIINSTTPMAIHDWSGNVVAGSPNISAYSGNSVGWARGGAGASSVSPVWNYISQTISVKAGTYTVNSATTWKAWTSGLTYQTSAAMFLLRVDSQIGSLYNGGSGQYALRSTKWDYQDPKSAWADKTTSGTFTTTTGNVQLIFAFQDNDGRIVNSTNDTRIAGFDNIVFKTNESIVPEPGSMLTLLAGMFGMAGFAIRRRK